MKKPARPAKPAKPKPFVPLTVAQQRQLHRKAARAWKPVPVLVQRRQHAAAIAAARKKPKKPARVGLAVAGGVACCAAQAVGTLLGWDEDDVLALYWRTASDPDSGASIADTLGAARISGKAPPVRFGHMAGLAYDGLAVTFSPYVGATLGPELSVLPCLPLILGVDLPGPHAVAVTPDGTWWSWGEPFSPADWPGMVIEEAWCLR